MRHLLRRLFRRRGLDADVQEEIESHLAMRAELNRQAGVPESEAMQTARKQFGNTTSVREQIYEFNGFAALDALRRDVRTGLRTFGRYPGITCVALLSLALGIGANSLAFSFVNVLLFPDLPYPRPDRLVIPDDPLTAAECLALRDQTADIFQDFGCFADAPPAGASLADERPGSSAEYLMGQGLTAGAGRALAVTPRVGRWLSETNETSSAERAIVISHDLWQRRFNGTSDVPGTPVRIDGEIATIIGVMPKGFGFLNWGVDYWYPLRRHELEAHGEERGLGAVARLGENRTIAQAQAILSVVLARRADTSSNSTPKPPVLFTRLDHFAQDQFQETALLLQSAVGFVLLIACANVAGLLLTQAVSQQREIAVRTAIGSGTWRIVRQVLVHSVLLFSAGGLLALAVGWAGVRLMTHVVMPYANSFGESRGGPAPGIADAGIDAWVLLFTFATALICGLLAAIAPALQVSRTQPLDVLRESSQSATSGIARQRLRSVFVTVQIGLAFVLLVGVALMLNGMVRTLNQNIGFDMNNLVTARLLLPAGSERSAMTLNTERMRQNLEAIPGVLSATGIAIYPPLSGAVNFPVQVDDRVLLNDQTAQFLPILPGYFKTLGADVIQGQEFGVHENTGNARVAIVNEAAARRFWPNESALGKTIQIQSRQLPTEPPRLVIGVVREVSQYSGQASRAQLYVPYSQLHGAGDERLSRQLRSLTFIVRTPRPAPEVASEIGEAIGLADRHQAVSSVHAMRHTAFAATYRRGAFIGLIGLFGIIAVVLALTGVYGVMANIVSQRYGEFGIRMALGAAPGQIRRLVIRQGSILIGIGLLLGILLSLGVTRVLRTFLFGISPTDPLTFLFGAVLLGGIALLACLIPAWRASRADAITALRHY
jgi:putative ABC transport system permease protein